MKRQISTDRIIASRLLLGKARRLLVKARKKELAPFRITPEQANVLTIIEDLGDNANFPQLARLTERKMNTLSVQMTRMEKEGLVEKVRVQPKSNQLIFKLTDKGRESCKAAKKIESIKTIMSALTEEEHRQFVALLNKIISRAEQY